jgi:cytochrome c
MIKLIKKTCVVAGVVMLMGSSAYAATGAELFTAKGCAGCHGADAKTPIMPAYPKIAGQNKEYLAEQLKDIKSGARNNGQTAAMKGIMAGVSEDEITTLAEYLAGLK